MGLLSADNGGCPRERGLIEVDASVERTGSGSFSLLLVILSASSAGGRGRLEITCVTEDEKKSSTRWKGRYDVERQGGTFRSTRNSTHST